MKTKDLLSQLDNIESLLGDFSYEELNTADASQLKKSFEAFKRDLEHKIFGEIPSDTKRMPHQTTRLASEKRYGTVPHMLIAKVSHEIRTPLNGIIGFADHLREDGLQPNQLEKVNAIQSASYNLLEIINELLEYSKLASGIEEFKAINFNFHSVIKDIIYLCNTLITEKNVELEVDIDSRVPEILVGDPSKLSQILLNLLGNSLKFVKKGKINLTINPIGNKGNPLQLQFSISDTGIGIPQDKLVNIFDPSKQADDDTYLRYGSSGLGLHIVKQIIDNLDGEISVNSTLGKGTTFNFMLPYTIGDVKKISLKKTGGNGNRTTEASIKGMCILVFEDNQLNQRLIEQRLKAWGCKTYITKNAKYGLEILENHKIDLVLMDLRMPGMDGFEVTELIRQNKSERVQKTPVIALSADFSLMDKRRCEKLGIHNFMLKPYSPDKLLSKMLKIKKGKKMILDKEERIVVTKIDSSSGSRKIDLSSVLQDCMGEIELLEELIRLYKTNALEFIGASKTQITLGNFKELEFAAHKIKAGLAMLQSHNLLEIVGQIKIACEYGGDLKHLQFLYTCFLEEYPKTEKEIDKALAKIKKDRI